MTYGDTWNARPVDSSGRFDDAATGCEVDTATDDWRARMFLDRELRSMDALRAEASAAVIARACEVRETDAGAPACLGCGARAALARVIVWKPASVGISERGSAHVVVGLCARCVQSCSDDHERAVHELATAAQLVDSLLSLVRHRAERLLSAWWGDVGNCTQQQIDDASVRARRAVERLGIR